ncbi:lumazine-binding domain protein [Nocardiopsis terrae]
MRRTLLCSLLLTLALTACEGGEEAPADDTAPESAAEGPNVSAEAEAEAAESARTVAEGFVAALVAGDGEAACAFTDEGAQSAITDQSEDAQDCAAAFPDYLAELPGAQDAEGFEIGEVTVSTDLDGETLIVGVELLHPEEDPGVLEVREGEDGQWRATRVPGAALGGA